MDWSTILGGAIDGAGVALAIVAVIFAYRAVRGKSSGDANADMRRQVAQGTFAVVACALAIVLFAIGGRLP